MGEYFQVELTTLSRYVTTLQDAQQQLAGLPKLLSGSDAQLGNGKLDDAAEHFQKSWEYGAGQLGAAVTETTDAVRAVAQAYTGADQAVADAMSSLSQPLGMIGDAATRLNGEGRS
jgi:hypothetical protein